MILNTLPVIQNASKIIIGPICSEPPEPQQENKKLAACLKIR